MTKNRSRKVNFHLRSKVYGGKNTAGHKRIKFDVIPNIYFNGSDCHWFNSNSSKAKIQKLAGNFQRPDILKFQ